VRIHVITVSGRQPEWVEQAWQEYARRMPGHLRLSLATLPLGSRGRGADLRRAIEDEGRRQLSAVPRGAQVIALEVDGRAIDTEEIATAMGQWLADGRDVALLIGGPDGLAPACIDASSHRWSLSRLTLPHGLVRVVLAEQLYRAWSILANAPYHRA